jgi:hypothetical protein
MAAIAARYLAFAGPFHYYLASAHEFLATGRMTDFHSVGYSLLIAAALRIGSMHGVLVLHAVILSGTAAAAVVLMRRIDDRPWVVALAGASIALNPILVANVTKISDNNLATLLLVLLVLALVRARNRMLNAGATLPLTLLFAATLLVRPNMALMFLPILWFSRRQLIAVVAAVAIAIAVNAWTTGRHWRVSDPFYVAYAFNNGNNPHAIETVRSGVSAESTSAETLEDAGIDQRTLTKDEATRLFWHTSLAFIRDHPADYLTLRLYKLVHFFAPYFRRGPSDFPKIVADAGAIVMALPVAIWSALRVWRRRSWTWTSGLLTPIVLVLYVLPFALINAEPRYRWPLDVLLVLESIALIAGRRVNGPATIETPPSLRRFG